MIAALLLRHGIPEWLVELILAATLVAGVIAWHEHAVDAAHTAGMNEEAAHRDLVDAKNTAKAQGELLALNTKVRAAQAGLATAQGNLEKLQQENDREKAISTQRQSDLLAGRERLRVLTARGGAGNPAQAGSASSTGAAAVDPGAGAVADLDPAVAAGLDGIREQHNEAVKRLAGCIAAYDAVKTAADALSR